MKKILKIVFLSLFVSSFAYAELKGISKMSLLVEDLSSKAASCGITVRKIETSVKYILSNSRIRIIDKLQVGTPTLYIQATISNNSGLCYANTKLQVYEYMQHPNSNNWGDFVYYTSSGIHSNSQSHFGRFFFEQLEDRVKRFIVDHNKDNR